MKLIILCTSILLVVNSCGNTKTTTESVNTENPQENEAKMSLNNDITVTVKENTIYSLEEDTIGALYPAFSEGDATVLVFNYQEKGAPGTADGDYNESIHIMIPNNMKEKTISGAALKDVGMTFGKFCFCKGEAGYHRVTNGTLYIRKSDGKIEIKGNFTIPEISHKITGFEQIILL